MLKIQKTVGINQYSEKTRGVAVHLKITITSC